MNFGFGNFIKKNGSEVSTVATDILKEEIEKREKTANIFPLEVFHPAIKPFVNALNHYYDIPRCYVGLGMLSTYSTAIGTSYAVYMGSSQVALPIWGCLCGISSSGKSLAIDVTHKPIYEIQDEFDRTWDDCPEDSKAGAAMQTVYYRDSQVSTLMRYVMPDNPKGVLKYADEIMEWINGMNSMTKKEGTDEQFWISSWNCKPYSGMRSNRVKFVIRKPFVNVIGGVQPSIMFKMFAKDRDTTGFIFRLLFAMPDVMKIAEPQGDFIMPDELNALHRKSIRSLYFDLPVEDPYDDPKKLILSPPAIKAHKAWADKKIRAINQMEEIRDKDIHSGILGKIKEYALRFAGILHLADKSYEPENTDFGKYRHEEYITEDVMIRALKLADYFYQSAADAYENVANKITAPPDVLIAATLFRQKGSMADIAQALYGDKSPKNKQKAYRNFKKWVLEYPRVFNANAH